MNETRTALVTGANKGIGYEIAAGLARRGFRVGVGARDAGRREDAVSKLRAEGLDVFGVPLDVTDDASVAAAAALLESVEADTLPARRKERLKFLYGVLVQDLDGFFERMLHDGWRPAPPPSSGPADEVEKGGA